MTYPIAYQLYSSRMFPPLEAHYPKLKAMGYDAIEPWLPAYEACAKDFHKQIHDAGLECFGFHFPAMGIFDETDRFLEYADDLGADYLIPAYLDGDDRPQNSEEWARFENALARANDAVKAYGKTLIWHNHEFEFVKLNDGTFGIDYIIRAGLRLEIDLAWVQVAGASPFAELKRLKDYIEIVQTKDKRADGDTREFGFARPGAGLLDWRELKPLIDAIAPHHIVVEHDLPEDWEKFAHDAITHIRSIGY